MIRMLATVAGALLTADLMWPSEGAPQGDGLHLVICWLAVSLGVLVALRGRIASPSTSIRHRWLAPLAVTLLFAGIWVSTWHVFRVHGDRRTALNLAFQWCGLVAAWYVVRRLSDLRARRLIVSVLITVAIGSAVLGVIQHHVIHGRQGQWYLQQRERLDAAMSLGAAGGVVRSEVEAEFRRMDIPLNGPRREIFERRLLGSSEPTGPFALANSLGGFLAAALVMLAGIVVARIRSRQTLSWPFLIVLCGLMLVLSYCLVLTKSRTSWIAGITGLVVIFFQLRSRELSDQILKLSAVAILLCAAVVGTAMATGALDREVVLESPRSVRFRLFYWMGSAGVIADSPVFGTGPGNFRTSYLAHKPPEASEEIQDPHNIFFDVWTSAGIIGVAGLACLAASILTSFRLMNTSEQQRSVDQSFSAESDHIWGASLKWCAVLGGVLHLGWYWWTGGDFENEMVGGPPGWANGVWTIPLCVALFGSFIFRVVADLRSIALPAAVTLLVHLMGAGGLQISGVVLLLLILHSLSSSAESRPFSGDLAEINSATASGSRPVLVGAAAVLITGLAICVFCFGIRPIRLKQLQVGNSLVKRIQGDLAGAERALRSAIQEDPLAVDSRQQLAELLAYDFVRDVKRFGLSAAQNSDFPPSLYDQYKSFEVAVSEYLKADRRQWAGYHLRGQIRQYYCRASGGPETADHAISDFRQATKMYPNNAALQADLARVLKEFGKTSQAISAAQKALRQDRINHEWGHEDRFLPADSVLALKRIQGSE